MADLLLVLAAFGIPAGTDDRSNPVAEDVNGDCTVTVGDLLLTLSAFGTMC